MIQNIQFKLVEGLFPNQYYIETADLESNDREYKMIKKIISDVALSFDSIKSFDFTAKCNDAKVEQMIMYTSYDADIYLTISESKLLAEKLSNRPYVIDVLKTGFWQNSVMYKIHINWVS